LIARVRYRTDVETSGPYDLPVHGWFTVSYYDEATTIRTAYP
jgi:hypothetical protein